MANNSQRPASFSDEIDDGVLQELYSWVDQIPLSRPKKNLTRDFSDGVMIAETVAYYFPKLVELHNYPPATGTKLKMDNWHVLNRKVFKKLHFELADDVIKQIVNCKPFVIERVLLMLRSKIDTILWEKRKAEDEQPEVDQHNPGSFIVSSPVNNINSNGLSREMTVGENQQKKSNRNGGLAQRAGPANAARADNPKQSIGGRDTISTDLVPRILLEEKVQECLVKEETIQILEAKIRRLEHLLHLKDIRIGDLQSRIDGIRPTGVK